MPAGGTHSLICGALWRIVVARHNGMAQAWCRAFSHCGVARALEPHVQQLPKFKRAAGLRALRAARDDTTTIRAHGLPQRADPALHNDPQSTRASVVPSTVVIYMHTMHAWLTVQMLWQMHGRTLQAVHMLIVCMGIFSDILKW